MKTFFNAQNPRPLLALALAAFAALATPSARLHSQLAPLPNDPGTAFQTLQQANADLIKRQEATLKELDEMTTQAREVRIFSRRG